VIKDEKPMEQNKKDFPTETRTLVVLWCKRVDFKRVHLSYLK